MLAIFIDSLSYAKSNVSNKKCPNIALISELFGINIGVLKTKCDDKKSFRQQKT